MITDKIKDLITQNNKKGNKKKIENLVVFIIILIITIIIINNILSDGKKTNEENNVTNTKQLAQTVNTQNNNETYNTDLEEKLENILKKINGVGEVKVFINYSETSTVVAMYNENTKESSTEETDTSGGLRTIQETDTQKEIVYTEENGDKKPITQKVIMPTIEGAIITADGASNATIKTNIIQAVEAVTGLATHKIQVFEMSK